MFLAVISRELRIAARNPGEWLQPLFFLLVVITLFPLGVGPSPLLLATLAPALIWITALLAVLLSVDRLFRDDFEDGTLEQWVLGSGPVWLNSLAKVAAHWLLTGLPIVCLSPLLCVMLNLDYQWIPTVALSLLLGTPILSLLAALGGALTVGLRQSSALLPIIIMPLMVPVLILATQAINSSLNGGAFFLWLAALLSFSLTFLPLAIAISLKAAVSR